MPLIPRFRRYPSADRQAIPLSAAVEIRFILARYDDGAIPPAMLAVIEQLRAEHRSRCPSTSLADAALIGTRAEA